MPRIDAGHGGRDLPAEEFFAQIVGVVERRCARPDDRPVPAPRPPRSCAASGAGLQPQIDEQAVVAIDVRRAERFAVDRDQALALLARRFRDQLLQPGAEIARCPAKRRSSACRGRTGSRRRRGWCRARTPGFSSIGTDGMQAQTISSVRSRNFGTSTPMMAAGTRPKSDSAE